MAIILWGKKTFFKRAQFQFFSFFGFFLKKRTKQTYKKSSKKKCFLKNFSVLLQKTLEFLTGLNFFIFFEKTFFKRAQFFSLSIFLFFLFFLKKLFSKKTKKVPKKSVFLKIFLFYFKNPEVFDRAQFFSFLFFFIFFLFLKKKFFLLSY